jgi:hypothetical protein
MNKTTKQLFDLITNHENGHLRQVVLNHQLWCKIIDFQKDSLKNKELLIEYRDSHDKQYHPVKNIESDELRAFANDREMIIKSHSKIEVLIYSYDFMDNRRWKHRLTINVPSSFIKPYLLSTLRRVSNRLEEDEEEQRRENRREQIYNNLITRGK